MATDVNVQFFSHLNGLALGNNWGDLIRLLDTCLANGLALPSVTAASIDANGDINLTFFAAHNAVLFQIVELTGFSPSNINAKYRIKGLPTSTQMILKAELTGQSITVNGSAKLAALGYDIIFRDANDVKRVYRAKNPTSAHPFIRVDESISSGEGSYTSTYSKSAMVGLIENMTHIDDYADTNKLQLPLDTSDFAKNWKITGTGSSVVRGWSKWVYADSSGTSLVENITPENGNADFTLCGDADAFYVALGARPSIPPLKQLRGCGLFSSIDNNSVNWFLMSAYKNLAASNTSISATSFGFSPLVLSATAAQFFTTSAVQSLTPQSSVITNPILPEYGSGATSIWGNSEFPVVEVPLSDNTSRLRGTLKHVGFVGKNLVANTSNRKTTPILSGSSMYVFDSLSYGASVYSFAGVAFYLGELE